MGAAVDETGKATEKRKTPSVQDIYRYEKDRIPVVLTEENYTFTSSDNIPVSRYTSREFLEQEYKHVWSKVWQMAGRLERIRNVGDYFLYEIGDLSLIIIRTSGDDVQALHNFCVHRGRKLVTHDGRTEGFRCPFHAWEYEIDGKHKNVPCKWDFAHLSDEELSLRTAKVDFWGGFVFVNFDPDCVSLKEYMGEFWTHFDAFPLDDTYTYIHLKKKLPCNWKAGIEAFSEGYHTIATHPQLLPFLADEHSQYDNYVGKHFNRMLNPQGIHSPHIEVLSDQEIVNAMLGGSSALKGSQPDHLRLPDGMNARSFLAESMRQAATRATGVDHSDRSDAEMLDVIQYTVFPNFFPWGGTWLNTLIYQFKPNGDDPDSCLLELYVLRRYDKAKPKPEPARLEVLEDDVAFQDATNMESMGFVFDQDMKNMELIQKGMKASRGTKNAISLTNYQESRVRDLHEMIDRYIEGDIPV